MITAFLRGSEVLSLDQLLSTCPDQSCAAWARQARPGDSYGPDDSVSCIPGLLGRVIKTLRRDYPDMSPAELRREGAEVVADHYMLFG